jgi:hypothetical protein
MIIGITRARAKLNRELASPTFTFCEKDLRIFFITILDGICIYSTSGHQLAFLFKIIQSAKLYTI